jgi:hypothetical protein
MTASRVGQADMQATISRIDVLCSVQFFTASTAQKGMQVSDVDCLSPKDLQALQPRVNGSGEAALVA